MKLNDLPKNVRDKLFPGSLHGLDKCFEPAKRILDICGTDVGFVHAPYYVNCGNCEHFDSAESKVHGDPCKKGE